jgi:hypothetical protein
MGCGTNPDLGWPKYKFTPNWSGACKYFSWDELGWKIWRESLKKLYLDLIWIGFWTFLNGDMGYCDDLRGTSFDSIIFFYIKIYFWI